MGAKSPIFEFLRIIHRTSDFGVLNIINNNFLKLRKTSVFGVFHIIRRNSDFGVLNLGLINDILKLRKTSDFGVFALNTQKLRFWSIKCY